MAKDKEVRISVVVDENKLQKAKAAVRELKQSAVMPGGTIREAGLVASGQISDINLQMRQQLALQKKPFFAEAREKVKEKLTAQYPHLKGYRRTMKRLSLMDPYERVWQEGVRQTHEHITKSRAGLTRGMGELKDKERVKKENIREVIRQTKEDVREDERRIREGERVKARAPMLGFREGRAAIREGRAWEAAGESYRYRTMSDKAKAAEYGEVGTASRLQMDARVLEQNRAISGGSGGIITPKGKVNWSELSGRSGQFIKTVVGAVVSSAAISSILRDTSYAASRVVRARSEYEMLSPYYRLRGTIMGAATGGIMGAGVGAVGGGMASLLSSLAMFIPGGRGLGKVAGGRLASGRTGAAAMVGANALGGAFSGGASGAVLGASLGSALMSTAGELYGEMGERLLTTKSAYYKSGARAAYLSGVPYTGTTPYIAMGLSGADVADQSIYTAMNVGGAVDPGRPGGGGGRGRGRLVGGRGIGRRSGQWGVRTSSKFRNYTLWESLKKGFHNINPIATGAGAYAGYNVGSGIGAGVGALAGGVGAVPGGIIGGLIGGALGATVGGFSSFYEGLAETNDFILETSEESVPLNSFIGPAEAPAMSHRARRRRGAGAGGGGLSRQRQFDSYRYKLFGKEFMGKYDRSAFYLDPTGRRGAGGDYSITRDAHNLLRGDVASGLTSMRGLRMNEKDIAARMPGYLMMQSGARTAFGTMLGSMSAGDTLSARRFADAFGGTNLGSPQAQRNVMGALQAWQSPSTDLHKAVKTASLMGMGFGSSITDMWSAANNPNNALMGIRGQSALMRGLLGKDLGGAYMAEQLRAKGVDYQTALGVANRDPAAVEEFKKKYTRGDAGEYIRREALKQVSPGEKVQAEMSEMVASAKKVSEAIDRVAEVFTDVGKGGFVASVKDFNDVIKPVTNVLEKIFAGTLAVEVGNITADKIMVVNGE